MNPNAYNATNLAFKDRYDVLESLKENPLIKQFSIKSVGELTALEAKFEHKKALLDSNDPVQKEKIVFYENAINTIEMLYVRMLEFTADLMIGINPDEEKEEIAESVEVESKLDVVHKKETPKKEEKKKEEVKAKQPFTLHIPDTKIRDGEVKSMLHDAIKENTPNADLISWMQEIFDNDCLYEESTIRRMIGKGEERIEKYINQLKDNPPHAPQEKDPLTIPKNAISIGKTKHYIKVALHQKKSISDIKSFINQLVEGDLIKDGKGIEKFKEDSSLDKLVADVKNGINAFMEAKAEETKPEAKKENEAIPMGPSPIEEILPTINVEEGTPTSLLEAVAEAENHLKSGERKKAIAVLKHYFREFGKDKANVYSDADFQRLLNWVDEDVFHHRSPIEILDNVPLSTSDVIKEVERQHNIEGTSHEGIESLIRSHVMSVQLKEMGSRDDVITDNKGFKKWFNAHCGFVFRAQPKKDTIKLQEEFESNLDSDIKADDGSDYKKAFGYASRFKTGMEKLGVKYNLDESLKMVLDKIKSINPKLTKAYEEYLKRKEERKGKEIRGSEEDLRAEDKEKSSPKEESNGENSSESEEQGEKSFKDRNPAIWRQTIKVTTKNRLFDFIVRYKELGPVELYILTKELINSGQITDAVTDVGKDKLPRKWDEQEISNWFRLGPGRVLEYEYMFTAKGEKEFVQCISKYVKKNSQFGQEEIINKIAELINIPNVNIRSKYIRQLVKTGEVNHQKITKLFKKAVETNKVSTT